MSLPPETVQPVVEPPPEAPATGGGRQITPQILALVGGIALVLIAAVYFLFLKGGGEEEPVAAPLPQTAPAPTTEPTTAPEPGNGPVENFEVFAPRDPFEPLVSTGGAGTGTGTGTVEGGTGQTGGTAGPGETGGTGVAGGGQQVGRHRVQVIDVYRQNGRDRAQIQVDDTVYTVDEGENFATNFRLVSASGGCATMLFGDDEFSLCEGEEILK